MKKLLVFLGVMLFLFGAVGMASAAPIYSFSVNGGASITIDPISGTESANAFYDFYTGSGHPGFEKEGEAFFWLYKDTDDNKLSLSVIFSEEDANSTGDGTASFNLSGLPSGWVWSLRDDSADFLTIHDTEPNWVWDDNHTDGGVIGNLENSSWNIIWDLTNSSGIDEWHFLDGDTSTMYDLSLSEGDSLTVSAASGVPEPSTMLLLGAGLIGLAGFRRRFIKS